MAKNVDNNIRRVYDFDTYRKVKRTVQKGIFRKRLVEVTESVPESYGEASTKVTEKILGMLETLLDVKPQIAGLKRENLPSLLLPGISLLVSNGEDRKIAVLDYGMRSVGGLEWGYDQSYVALTIFGDSMTPEQFNTLQFSNALRLPKENRD